MNRVQTVVGSAALASFLMVMPLFASAETLQAKGSVSTGVVVSPNGIVRVIGADVTAVSNGVVSAMTKIGGVIMNWVVNVSASTKVFANGSKHATTTDVKVGDRVAFAGTLSSSTASVLTVAASKIRDFVMFPLRHIGAGTITSVNTANGSFVLTEGDKSVTIQTNSSTIISVNGATTTLASLKLGEKVWVAGTRNTDGSTMTATTVVIRDPEVNKSNVKDDEDTNKDEHTEGDRHESGKKTSSKVNADANAHVDSNVQHTSLKLLGGFHFGIGKDD